MAQPQRDRMLLACGAKAGSVEDYPFGDGVAVFKVAGKMFALVPLDKPPGSVSLKCDPDMSANDRESPCVTLLTGMRPARPGFRRPCCDHQIRRIRQPCLLLSIGGRDLGHHSVDVARWQLVSVVLAAVMGLLGGLWLW